MGTYLLVLYFLFCSCKCLHLKDDEGLKFPEDFMFGVATSAYQIEGGWNATGKGLNIWDSMTHDRKELILDHSNGDVACNSYNLLKKDIDMLKNLKVNFYRFSLSWSRILPKGFSYKINEDGIRYYNDLINGLISNNIIPMVSIFHWDLPQVIQDLGGWANEKTADYYADYARVVFRAFGDRVKYWITINEPFSICEDSYGRVRHAPAIKSPGIGDYLCGKTVLLAHAKAYKIYNEEFRTTQQGKVGITNVANWFEPYTNKTEDIEAAERLMQMHFGWFINPIFSKNGDYPAVMKTRIKERSLKENFTESRLPEFSLDQIKLLRGSADFMGLNHYYTNYTINYEFPIMNFPYFGFDIGVMTIKPPNGEFSCPWGFRKLLNWIKENYNNPTVIITENGYEDTGGFNDVERVNYYRGYINAVLKSIKEDKCNVKGFTAWSLMDNMEWEKGYLPKFGLYHVNFTDPERIRTPKLSASFFKYLSSTKTIPDEFNKCLAFSSEKECKNKLGFS